MIIIFGPAGAGKSVQGQILAARQGWRWLSAGQLLRDTRNTDLLQIMGEGKLVPLDNINQIMGEAINRATAVGNVILDGFPRQLEQAKWLLDNNQSTGPIGVVFVLEVPRDEIMKRLQIRGRVDDTPESIDERLRIYNQEICPILDYFTENNVKVVRINGVGTVEQVHDKIMEELVLCKLI